MNSLQSRTEITWSIMHPMPPDVGAMRALLEHAKRYRVDSFEICGECHKPHGGLEGIVAYEKYPAIHHMLDHEKIAATRQTLREILSLAHGAGKPVFYWHREVMIPPKLAEVLPSLLDENGEFDLLGETYSSLLAYKIAATFEALPDLDGIALTLTESDFSVIHNSRPDRYPPAEVVSRIAGIFARELSARGKRFILRSFGSIPQDYIDILAGADAAARDFPFEVETKITPYDFDPFLPINPYLQRGENTTLGAEFDCVGEFLGAGRLPAANVERIVGYVRAAQERRADRFVIRIDRVGVSIFDTSYEVNLHAYHRAIEDGEVTPESIYEEWAARHWPGCEAEMCRISEAGIRTVEKINFISGNVIFHTLPSLDPGLKWVKAGGILSMFKENVPLKWLSGIWSIMSETSTPPSRQQILQEKEDALEVADNMLVNIEALNGRVSPNIQECLRREWGTARETARLYHGFCRAVCAYFDDMERDDPTATGLEAVFSDLKSLLSEFLSPEELLLDHAASGTRALNAAVPDSMGEFFNPLTDWRNDFKHAIVIPLVKMLLDLREEYALERQARARWRAEAWSYILLGTATDDWRTRRFMHASHAQCENGYISREVGNHVFPNGFVEFELSRPEDGNPSFVLETAAVRGQDIQITLDGQKVIASLAEGKVTLPLNGSKGGTVQVRLEKSGRGYPRVNAAAICLQK